jgi:hypothetical protein
VLKSRKLGTSVFDNQAEKNNRAFYDYANSSIVIQSIRQFKEPIIQIFNTLGEESAVNHIRYNGYEIIIPFNDMLAGIYYIILYDNSFKKIDTFKLFITK